MSARTEQPTPRRLREARRRGEAARGRDLPAAAALLAGLAAVAVAVTGPGATATLARLVRSALSADPAGADPAAAVRDGLTLVLRLSLPVCGAALAASLAAALVQGPTFSLEALRPRLERLDPVKGLGRLVSPGQLAATALGVAKAAVLVAVGLSWLRGAAPALEQVPRLEPAALWRVVPLLGGLALRLGLALALVGLADAALARRRHRRALMMTRDEVRREQREDDGDPAHKAERRRRHRALLEASPVSRATVVVVNPTHVAVALRHDRGGDEAPRVLAKGTGLAAARIRSAARRAGVPIVRNVALARALHRLVDVGDELPEELYEAAAAVLAHLYGVEEVSP